MSNDQPLPPRESWSLYAWEDGWVQLNVDYDEEDDANRALAIAEDEAQLLDEDDETSFRHFIVVPEHDENFIFPPDPTRE